MYAHMSSTAAVYCLHQAFLVRLGFDCIKDYIAPVSFPLLHPTALAIVLNTPLGHDVMHLHVLLDQMLRVHHTFSWQTVAVLLALHKPVSAPVSLGVGMQGCFPIMCPVKCLDHRMQHQEWTGRWLSRTCWAYDIIDAAAVPCVTKMYFSEL